MITWFCLLICIRQTSTFDFDTSNPLKGIKVPDYATVKRSHKNKYSAMEKLKYRFEITRIGQIALFARAFKHFELANGYNYYNEFPRIKVTRKGRKMAKECAFSFPACIDRIYSRLARTFWFDRLTQNIWRRNFNFSVYGPRAYSQGLKKSRWMEITYKDFEFIKFPWGNRQNKRRRDMITALYYLCWYTFNEMSILAHLPYCDYTTRLHNSFIHTNYSKSRLMRGWIPMPDKLDDVPYRCATFSFCPDPCCGSRKMENREEQCRRSRSSPCKSMTDKTCYISRNENRDFERIIRNRFNTSCKCDHPGFYYSRKLASCLDRDECKERARACPEQHMVCLNTVGRYRCVCEYGYRWLPGGGCVAVHKPEDEEQYSRSPDLFTFSMYFLYVGLIGCLLRLD